MKYVANLIKMDRVSVVSLIFMFLLTGIILSLDCNPFGVRSLRGWEAVFFAIVVGCGDGVSIVAFVFGSIKNYPKNGGVGFVVGLVAYLLFIHAVKHLFFTCLH